MENGLHSRRRFITESARLFVVVTSFSMLTCSCGNGQSPQSKTATGIDIQNGKLVIDINRAPYRALKNIGGGVKLDIESAPKPVIVTRVSATEVAAFSSQCTHAGYEVLLPEHGVLICESGHGGEFDLRGDVIEGPPKSNLQKYPALLDNYKVYIDYPL